MLLEFLVNIRQIIILTIFALVLINICQQQCFAISEEPKGFLWYNEETKGITKTKELKEVIGQPETSLNQKKLTSYDQRIEFLKQSFNNAQRQALDNPTLANVIIAQRLQKQIMDKSARFASMWQLAALIDYKLNNLQEPSNSLHKKIQEQSLEQENTIKLKQIAKSWGIILQISPACPYCHSFAPIVKEFAKKYGFQLLAVSNSGQDFAGIEGTKDAGFLLLSSLNPQQIVPVLYLVSNTGDKIYPIARGIATENKIIENIMMIDKHYQKIVKLEVGNE